MRFQNAALDIDLAAICENYRRLGAANPGAEAAAVVKCDAYGLGVGAVSTALFQAVGCRAFFVAYAEEGVILRRVLGPDAAINVFNGPFAGAVEIFRDNNLTPALNSFEQAALWAAEMPGADCILHVDTGMHRLGLDEADAARSASNRALNITMVMSHLACASEPSNPMNEAQHRAFSRIAALFPGARKSLASSGGALLSPDFAFDQVRIGVGLYGVNPLDAGANPLRPAATLTAPVVNAHEAKAGQSVGYGATHRFSRDTRLATVLLGYGDGYPRAASNRGAAFLGGALCPIVGRVSMDLIVLDVSALETPPAVGDRAEFFGPNLPIETAAEACGTIGYELLTGIGGLARPRPGLGGRVLRRYVFDGAPVHPEFAGA